MEKFYLESNEELFSIIDRIKRSRDERITLVIPGGLSTLRSIINLRVLKEESISLGKEIAVITSDNLIKKLAQQSGIEVLEKIETKRENKRVMSDIVTPRSLKPIILEESVDSPEEPINLDRPLDDLGDKEEEFEELFQKSQKSPYAEIIEDKIQKQSLRFFTTKRLVIVLVIFIITGLGFGLCFILPRAQVTIIPKKETIHFETEISADKNIDSVIVADNSIPGQVFQLEMEDSRNFPTTGEKDIEEYAKGKIMVYNQYSSSDQTLVKTTRFLSEGGKLFRLVETIIIPGAIIEEGQIIPSSKEVEIIADETGEAYNIGPSKFTIPGFKGTPKYESFYAASGESMTGGAKGRMRVATQDDIEGATEIVSLELKEKIQKQFDKKIPKDLKFLEDAQVLEIVESNSTLQADQPGKEFVITIKARAWGLAFKEEDVFYLIKENISDKISDNKILVPSSIEVNYSEVKTDLVQGKAVFTCQVKSEVAWNLDKETLRENLIGRNEIEVRKYLSSLAEIESAKVMFWPFWVKKIPQSKAKIKIIIEAK